MIAARLAADAADFVDDEVVGAETARAAVVDADEEEDAEEDDEAALPLPPLRGEATAEAGLAQAVLLRDAPLLRHGRAATPEERSDVAESIFVVFFFFLFSFFSLCSFS